jgi:transketolase
MRNEFAAAVIAAKANNENLVFITGDLGYMALEKVEQTYGDHFVNAGVAEQNMVTVAAALAYEGFVPFVYSIAPFVTLRPFEQIRNDVCLHNLPVKLVGNGGGYGYGIMGATHHNPEDIGALRMLPNMRIYVPLVAEDVEQCVQQMIADKNPNYLRLNLAAKFHFAVPAFAQWRHLKHGDKAVLIATGPILQNIAELDETTYDGLDVWNLSVFPVKEIPKALLAKIAQTGKVIFMEEHYGEGGMRETLSYHLLASLQQPVKVLSLAAQGYASGKYGSQKWHQEENGLSGNVFVEKVQSFV